MRGREVEREKNGSKVLGWNGGDENGETGAELKTQLLLSCSCCACVALQAPDGGRPMIEQIPWRCMYSTMQCLR